MTTTPRPLHLFVDADASPRDVKDLVFRASERLALPVVVVANKTMHVPRSAHITMVQVKGGPDVADDYIVEHGQKGDIAITADVPLAARLVEKALYVLDPRGFEYDAENVGERLSMRDFMADVRDAGVVTGGPSAFGPKDKARFANALDRVLHRARAIAPR
jgi:uncharacterized protein YaiI (UPF0178 family)